MFDGSVSTQEHPPPAPRSERSAERDSFIPGERVDDRRGTQLATETRWLLHQRLRAVALVLVVGFGLFFARSLLLNAVESMTVLFHGLMLALPVVTLGRFRADGSRACGSSGRSKCFCSA